MEMIAGSAELEAPRSTGRINTLLTLSPRPVLDKEDLAHASEPGQAVI